MLKIRLQRIGKKNQPSYRVVLVEHTYRPQGKYIEDLGFYNPRSKQKRFKKERIDYWLTKGAHLSPTVHNLLVDERIIKEKKVKAWKAKRKKSEEKPATTETPKTEEVKVEEPKTAPTPEGVGVPTSPPEAESIGEKPEEKKEEGVDPVRLSEVAQEPKKDSEKSNGVDTQPKKE